MARIPWAFGARVMRTFAASVFLSACSASIPNTEYPGLRSATEIIPSEPLHWRPRTGKGDLVTLALSGGGVKSATFSSEVMFYLKAIGLLSKVNLISSVSGGSYAAARYALSCDPGTADCRLPDGRQRPVWDYATTMRVMRRPLTPLVLKALPGLVVPFVNPTVSPGTYAAFLNKTYLLPDGAPDRPYIFADLDEARRPPMVRPRLVLNATIVSDFRYLSDLSAGLHFLRRRNADEFFHFGFTPYFFNSIGSRLDNMPVSYGVAASGAFPLLIDYVPLVNYRACLQRRITDPSACARDSGQQLALIDGGANDNQGYQEVYALLGELLLHQARSDNSADPGVVTQPPEQHPEWMRRGDRALLIAANSALTEATGLKRATDSPPWLLGNIIRSSGAVDVYSGTEVSLRRRLYVQNLQAVNDQFAGRSAWGYRPITAAEISLMTLDRYRDGGIEASAVLRSGIRMPPNGRCDTPGIDQIACEIEQTAVPQRNVWQRLRGGGAWHDLMLGHVHPQCLFEQSKFADGFTSGLMSLTDHLATCLRRAARWATALTVQELCDLKGNDTPINDRNALSCGSDGRLRPPLLKPVLNDALDECDFTQNSDADNREIVTHLANNFTFREESKQVDRKIEVLQTSTASGAELGRALNDVCDLDANPMTAR
jgi:hypothetical protein